MSLIVSTNIVLSAEEEAFPDGTPYIGYHNVVTATNVSATTAENGYPASNLANPATHLYWQATSADDDQYLVVDTNYLEEIDYVAFARHNFGSSGTAINIEAYRSDSQVKILLPFNGADGDTSTLDYGQSRAWTFVGNAQIDNAESPHGGTSLLLDGSGDWITTPDSVDLALGSLDWTLDTWFNRNGGNGTFRWMGGQGNGTAANRSVGIFLSNTNVVQGHVSNGVVDTSVVGSTAITTNGWHHVAFVRTGNTLKLFVDGVQEGGNVSFSAAIFNSSTVFGVGVEGSVAGSSWNGWLKDFRLTVGEALWTANFTPPTMPAANLVQEFMPADDSPLLVQFTPQILSSVIVRLVPGSEPPEAAVMYIGKLLILERSIDVNVDHTPINQGRITKAVNGMSTSGNFLGRIVTGETRMSTADFRWFTPEFYRSDVDPFVVAAQEAPFFWAWYPTEYPNDVGYVWTTTDLLPEVDPVTQRVALEIKMQGIA